MPIYTSVPSVAYGSVLNQSPFELGQKLGCPVSVWTIDNYPPDCLLVPGGVFFSVTAKKEENEETFEVYLNKRKVTPYKSETEKTRHESKTENPSNTGTPGNGMIKGPWNETGQKIAEFFFTELPEGSIIYLNGSRNILTRKNDVVDLTALKV